MAREVDYAAIDRVISQAREQFPYATKIKPVWYGGRPMAEVWDGNRARTFDPERS